MTELIITFISLTLIVSGIIILVSRNFLELIIGLSIFSLMISLLYLSLDAPDVAMTEVSLGCALSTIIILVFAKHLNWQEVTFKNYNVWLSVILVVGLGIILFYAGLELAEFGTINTKVHESLNRYYIDHASKLIGIPSMPAAILASFRGYDTLGETCVILIAALGVFLIISKKSHNDK